jgi:aminoglycoside phosphotransferase (APT) family kinase protein
VAATFGLDAPTGDTEVVARGAMGEVSRLVTDRGTWAVKRLFEWANSANADTDVMLQEAAAKAGVRLPAPVRSVNGKVIEAIGEDNYRVYEWVDIPSLPSAPASSVLATEIGRTLGIIHSLRVAANGPVTPWLTTHPPAERWDQVVAGANAASAPWLPLLTDALPAIRSLESVADRAAQTDPILCHNDFGPGNVGVESDGGIIVLDWEHAGPQDPLQELGYVLVGWCTAGDAVSTEAARALAAGYTAKSSLPASVDIGMFGGIACGNLNFTVGQAFSSLYATDADQKRFATTNVTNLLRHPVTVEMLEAVLDAITT